MIAKIARTRTGKMSLVEIYNLALVIERGRRSIIDQLKEPMDDNVKAYLGPLSVSMKKLTRDIFYHRIDIIIRQK